MKSLLARYRFSWYPAGELADRLALLLLSMVALRFANWLWLTERVPGKAALALNLGIQYAAFLVFVVLVALACRREVPRLVSGLRLHRLLGLSPLFAAVLLLGVGYGIAQPILNNQLLIDDANAMAVCGARAISSGRNPYQISEVSCLDRLRLPLTLATPFQRGPLSGVKVYPTPQQIAATAKAPDAAHLFSKLDKPPLDPLVMVPVDHAPAQLRAIWTLLAIVVLLLAVGIGAGPVWPVAVGLLLLNYVIPGSQLDFASFGNAEAVAYVLLGLSVLWLRRPALSGVLLGLALASNQLAWFFLPGYFLLSLEQGALLRRGGTALLALAVGVVPWLVRYPDMLRVLWDNLRAPTFPLGYGPIELAVGHLVPPPPRLAMFILTGLVMLAIFGLGLLSSRWRLSCAVLFLAAFWLNWRSLDEYMAQIPMLALVAVLVYFGPPRSSAREAILAPPGSPGEAAGSPPWSEGAAPSPGDAAG